MERTNRHFGLLSHCTFRLLRCPMISRSIVTPTALVIFIVMFCIWVLLEVPYLLPRKPGTTKAEELFTDISKPLDILHSSTVNYRLGSTDVPHFLWSSHLSRNVSSYVRLDRDTTLLNPLNKCSAASIRILFVVPSAIDHAFQRDAIRKTWGSWILNKSSHHSQHKNNVEKLEANMELVFILGRDEKWMENRIGAKIIKESIRYKDIIVENFIDSYTNLTLKSIFLLKWVDRNCPQATYIMKADDDMFIHVPNLLTALDDPTFQNAELMGSLICNARPIKNPLSKWYSPSHMFSGKYPNYVSGTSYLIAGSIVKKLLRAAVGTPYFHLEDVFITGICAKKIGVRPVNNIGFSYLKRAFNPCVYKEIITGHDVKAVDMKKLWNMLHNISYLSKCKPIPKKILYPYFPGKCVWS